MSSKAIKMKIIQLILISLLAISCEKEYFPDKNAYRDPNLVGTWVRLEQLYSDNPTIEIYNDDGYCGGTISYNNAQSNYNITFQDIDGLWYVEQACESNGIPYNRIYSQKRFRNGIWEHTEEYFFKGDTLFLRDLRYDWDTLVKYKYQLIYNGPNFVGVDSSGVE